MNTLPTTSTLESVNYQGKVSGYGETPRRTHYLMQHRTDTIQRKLTDFIEPFVECGFDAEQIQAELHYQGETLVTLGQINSIINIILEK